MDPQQSLTKLEDGVSISDNIIISFNCPDSNGCFLQNPYKFNNFTIYYVNRNYSNNNTKYEKITYDAGLKANLDKAIKIACLTPTQENLDNVEKIRLDYNNSVAYTDFYYSDAVPVLSIGNDVYPAWVENDIDNSQVLHITTDEDDNEVFGKFQYIWTPLGMREGDYFICWNWTPEVDGQVLSDHVHFNLNGNTVLTTSIPTHNTKKDKYEILLDRYTPEMFKTRMGSKDLTPETIQELNKSVAKGFTYLEDMSNHILDLTDANSTHESFLQLLSNLFGIKLRTNDPTLWRRQIKEAVSLSKKKGTYSGLKEALNQASIILNKFTRLWQVTSKYTYQEVFTYEGESSFILDQISLDVNSDNFELYIRENNSLFWTELNLSNISLSEDVNGNLNILNWEGDTLTIGDSIRFIYQITEVPTLDEQTNEDYIRLLPLSDNRDERSQEYPLKNWNIRVIEEDDPMFDLIITKRNPDFENLVYGKIRTEFPYSENIYNMDEYNGCVTGNTKIITNNGIKCIKDVTPKDTKIKTEFGFKNFEKLICHGNKNIKLVKTKMGREIEVTNNHEFKIIKDGKLCWENNIKIGDYILGKKGLNPHNEKINDLWYLIGFLYGDGYLDQNKINWLIPESELESLEKLKNILKNVKYSIFERTPEKHSKNTSFTCNQKMYIIRSSGVQLPELFDLIPKYEKKGKWKKSLPISIWNETPSAVCGFLQGLFDTDGTVQKGQPLLTTKWKNLALEVQELLLSIGILSSVTCLYTKWKGEKRKYYRVRILGENSRKIFIENINFSIKNKKIALENFYDSTNLIGKSKNILNSDRVVVPFATQIIKNIFPSKKRISKNKANKRDKREKRVITSITRMKQGYIQSIPDNLVLEIYEKSLLYGIKNDYFNLIENYVKNDWFFDKIISIEDLGPELVYDPLNVSETNSYISNGLISHNSTRDSLNPCDIDKNFIDTCHSCLSSKFTIDLEIDKISNDRILEAQEVIKEFVPFHSILHSMNLSGGVTEYVKPAIEKIEALIKFNGNEFTIAGSAQNIFSRSMQNSSLLKRNELTDSNIVISSASVVGYNEKVTLYSPLINFNDLPINKNKDWTYLEISGPSLNQGIYKAEESNKHSIKTVGTFYLPLDKTAFNYKLSNIRATKSSIVIYKDNYITFIDTMNSFESIKSEWSVINDQDYLGTSWKINFPLYGTFNIINILPNNVILLAHDSLLPTTNISSISYDILNDVNEIVFSGTTGAFKITNRGRVDFSGTLNVNGDSVTLDNIKTLMDSYHNNGINHYLLYDGDEYEFFGFVENSTKEFYIKNWTDSDFSGSSDVMLLQRLINNDKGYFQYNGFYIDSDPIDFEATLPIQNGNNSSGVLLENDTFKENYLIKINSNYYSIIEIDEFIIKLAGPEIDCSLNGTNLNIDILNYNKLSFYVEENDYSSIPATDFQKIDRRGKEIVTGEMPELFSLALNTNDDQIIEKVDQNESINFIIKDSNGETIKGNI